jgi:hypothetical protein
LGDPTDSKNKIGWIIAAITAARLANAKDNARHTFDATALAPLLLQAK